MADSEKKPTPPDARPGMRADLKEEGRTSYGRVEVVERFADLDDPLAEIPDDTEADLEEVKRKSRVQEVLDRLDRELVALHDVKRWVAEIAALLLIDKVRRSMGLDANPPTLHMSFDLVGQYVGHTDVMKTRAFDEDDDPDRKESH